MVLWVGDHVVHARYDIIAEELLGCTVGLTGNESQPMILYRRSKGRSGAGGGGSSVLPPRVGRPGPTYFSST